MRSLKKNIQHVKKIYHPLLISLPKELRAESWLRIAHSKKYSFVYIRIPKAANSTISMTLAKYCFPDKKEAILSDNTGETAKKHLGNLGNLKYYRQNKILEDFFVFCFFRNPFTRLLSAYLDKLQSNNSSEKFQWIAKSMNKTSTKQISFADFISFIEGGNLYKNAHWAPQTNLCPFKIKDLHFIGKMESINKDLPIIMNKIFGTNIHRETIICNQHRRDANKKLKLYYNRSIVKRVEKLYQADLNSLKYNFPVSLNQ